MRGELRKLQRRPAALDYSLKSVVLKVWKLVRPLTRSICLVSWGLNMAWAIVAEEVQDDLKIYFDQ